MTNNYAIQILREMIPKFARCNTDVEKLTAINLAIKALDEQRTNLEKMRDALDSVVWYNGYWDNVKEWIDDLEKLSGVETFYHPKSITITDGGLEVLWMICVLLFGNYGTSPRSGWVEKTKECREFLIWLTKDTKSYEEGN
jgi:hypothetical protein